jgi:hypothetical protein
MSQTKRMSSVAKRQAELLKSTLTCTHPKGGRALIAPVGRGWDA